MTNNFKYVLFHRMVRQIFLFFFEKALCENVVNHAATDVRKAFVAPAVRRPVFTFVAPE